MRRGQWQPIAMVLLVSLTVFTACMWKRTRPPATPTFESQAAPTDTPTPAATPTPLPPDTPVPEGMVPPIVVQRSPETGEELPLNGAIELVFDRPMDRTAVEKAFEVSPAVQGRFEWPDERTVRFVPANLKRGAEYHVYLGQSARDKEGAILKGAYRFRFQTVGYLEVGQVVPAPDSKDVEPDSTIMVVFNRPVVPLTTLSRQADLPNPLVLDPPVAGRGEWLNTSIYVFYPDAPLPGGTRFTARVPAGLSDVTGGVLDKDYVWSFSTEPPKVVWTSPRSGGKRPVPPDTEIRVTFNQPIDPESAREAFSLEKGGVLGGKVKGKVEVYTDTLVFTPQKMLDFDRTYVARVEAGVLSAAGGEGMRVAYEWKFQTVPLPRVVSTEPRDGERDAPPHTSFSIVFNTTIDPKTVMPNLEFDPPISPTQVYTYFREWDYTFVVGFGARPSTDYKVRIRPGIADPYGNTIGKSLTVRFRTGPLAPAVAMQLPGNVGTLNADEEARLFVRYVNLERLDLRLYRLSRQELSEMQRDWGRYEPKGLVRKWREKLDAPLNEWRYARVDLVEGGGKLEPGFYLVEMSSPDLGEKPYPNRYLLIVSAINLTIKTTADEVRVWATDLNDGRPVASLELTAYDWRTGTRVAGPQRTDADGLTRFKVDLPRHSWLLVVADDPFTAGSNQWSQGISPWEFGFSGGEMPVSYRIHVYTERSIYRAGQTVYFRGVVRREDDVNYSLPALKDVHVNIRDASGETVLDRRLPLDEWGTFYGELSLDQNAPLGRYWISVEAGGQAQSSIFTVAAYRPPEFEVTVKPEQEAVVMGRGNRATVAVRYFFGGPVKDAPVQWRVLGEKYVFAPPQYARYSFDDADSPWICRYCWWRPTPPPQQLLNGSGYTDEQGNLTIELPGEWQDADGRPITHSLKLIVEATVSGPDGQVISGRDQVVVHRSNFYIGLAPQQYVGRAEKEMRVDLLTVDWEANRLPHRRLRVAVYRREWKNVFVKNEAGGGRWKWTTHDIKVGEQEITTGDNGEATFTFIPPQGGSYHVIAESLEAVPPARSSIFVWVSGSQYISWRRTNEDRIDLIADKGEYLPGETAEILIPSPFQGEQWVWITVEREGVLYQEVVHLQNNSYVYRLPITDRYIPNVYVSAVIIKGKDADNPFPAYKVGYVALSVRVDPKKLHINLKPAVSQAEPGQKVRFDVQVTDDSGEPVAAALSLDLVDKAVLSLMPRPAEAIVKAFYGRRRLGVQTASGLSIALSRLLREQEEELESNLQVRETVAVEKVVEMKKEVAATAAPAPGAEGDKGTFGATPPPGVELREKFADTAYWKPNLVTDRSGRGQVEIEMPDNLTTWVLRGVGVTKDTMVGEATVELLVTKPLLVRPVTPRFFVVGDEVQLAALVSNNTDGNLETEVTMSSTGLSLRDPAAQRVVVPARGEAKVTWWATVEDVPQVEVIFSAVAGQYSDAARPRLTTGPEGTLMVYRYTAPEVVGTGGQLIGSGARTEVIALPPRYNDRRGELMIQLDPSLAAGMRDGLAYLEHFEYECTEQTVSRFLPNVLTYRALKELAISDPELEKRLPPLVREGIEKLTRQQREDGGWGWWPGGRESNPYITAYVILGLVKAREADFAVDQAVIRRGLDYLNGQLVTARRFANSSQANRQAFMLYVMAEAGDTARASEYTGDLFDNRARLSHYGKAFLALTIGLVEGDDTRIKTLLSDLTNAAILSATGTHWEEHYRDWWAMNTDTRSTAVILDALARLDPDNELIPNVVRWLMVARRGGHWETTQETAWALIAFTDWMRVTGELRGNYEYAVALNDKELAAGKVTPDNVDESIKLRVAIADLLRDRGNYLKIGRGPGEGRLYYTAHLRVYLPVEEIGPLNRGIIVYREYTDAACTPAKDAPCPEIQEVRVGDVVRVRLTIIAPHDLYYVVVEDPLPAGGEAIDPHLATTSVLDRSPWLQRRPTKGWEWFYRWWWNWYSRTEMRDEKVVLFADYLPKGTYEYTYTFRVTVPGEYRVIPTVASEMYFPEVFGRSDGRLLTVAGGD